MTWCVLLAALGLVACAGEPPARVEAPPPTTAASAAPDGPLDLVLVSLDTTRADALGVYGEPLPVTPHHDAQARRGVRFAWAIAQSPTTLASHSTVFTGLDPHGTRIVRNGYALDPGVETLAERLAAHGYDTMGVIGASALARPMNVDQGFRIWDEDLGVKVTARHEAPAGSVTDRALTHLAEREPGKPLFLFVHYYDAHAPYGAPEPFLHRFVAADRQPRYAGRAGELDDLGAAVRAGEVDTADLAEVRANYLGEVAYADQEFGRLLSHLDLTRTVVVVFGDHGEALGDLRDHPFGHGLDLDLVATHVPLYLVGPGLPSGAVVDTPIGLQDLPATLLAALGVTEPFGASRDRSALWSVPAPPLDQTWLMEATQPEHRRGDGHWNNLGNERGALRGDRLLITAPYIRQAPVLYRVASGQPRVDDADSAASLLSTISSWDAAAPPWRTEAMSSDTREGLRALGYLE